MILQYLKKIAERPDKLGFGKKKFVDVAAYELAVTPDQAEYLWNRLVGRNKFFIGEFNDPQRREFLDLLDKSDIELNTWELSFVQSTMGEMEFTPAQKEAIDRMIGKYRDALKW